MTSSNQYSGGPASARSSQGARKRTRHFLPRGSLAAPPFSLAVSPQDAGWRYSGLKVLELEPGGQATIDTGEDELIVLPLSGSCEVECQGARLPVKGRPSVFTRVTDFVYVPKGSQA